ncbi:adenylate/guanylate cyclase domain-containing protein [Clavibacter sp. VKM Ac-2542]|uniref:adenylate/guanylate cyclase domain-containing protein n=1 Tax=Clavibacter sp. VKM Ac-2542 TaxID=2783811 RepID=UPI00188C684B|nr:adenylate/guanylate cyclase domain-containing protein [Clavibacter sp. VKM Ac-2542]MBF4622367.1 adenylate/guanylate cyclase domain-containing protein [Clavibacter sp. VKM Ac-2542]
MGIDSEIQAALGSLSGDLWNVKQPTDVPKTEDIVLRDGAAIVNATYLYADLANSSTLAQKLDAETAARVIRMYLNMSVRVLRHKGGHIRSFDGDRVMAVFMGDSKNTNAFRAAMAINYYVAKVIPEYLRLSLPAVGKAGWGLKHGIGIDSGQSFMVRGGVRDNNDLISIGSAPNVAAKLADIRDLEPIHISNRALNKVKESVRRHADGRNRYQLCGTHVIGGESLSVSSSGWYWSLED